MVAHNEIALETARQGIVLLEERRRAAARRRDYRSHRGDRWSCPGRRAGRHRLECGRPSRRVRGRRSRSAAPGSRELVRNLYLLPSSPFEELKQAPPRCADRVRPGDEPGGVGAAGAAFGRGHRVRDSCGGRVLRPPRPVAAVGARTR